MALISSDEHSAPRAALYFPCQTDGGNAALIGIHRGASWRDAAGR